VNEESDLDVMAAPPGDDNWVKQRVAKDAPDCTILLASAFGPLAAQPRPGLRRRYDRQHGRRNQVLKAEIKGIAAAIRTQYPQVNLRYSLVLYRDENMGDEYVTRVFDFTDSIDEFRGTWRARAPRAAATFRRPCTRAWRGHPAALARGRHGPRPVS